MRTSTLEMSSMIVASAEPKPMRLASPTTFWVTRAPMSSSPLRPLLITQTMSKARSDSMKVTTTTMMLIGRMTGKTTLKNVVVSLAPSILADSRTGVPPARGDQDCPQVDVRVAVPVGRAPRDRVEQALVTRVDQLPDEADEGQREHDRQVDARLVEPGARQ